ncbi:MAG: hypothetical protein B7Z55_11515, partial [Planctomycetales bacterium 12-60-4]
MLAARWLCATLVWTSDPVFLEPNPQTGQSLAVRVDGGALVHTGQIWSAAADAPVPPAEQVVQTFSKLRDALKTADADLSDIVKLNVYVSHSSITKLVEQELIARYRTPSLPAVSFVQTRLPDPTAMVALDAVARTRRAGVSSVTVIDVGQKDEPSPAAILPEGGVAYISGQAERGDGSLADATRQTLASLWKTLAFLGREPQHIVQLKAFLTPMTESATVLEEIRRAFGDRNCPPVVLVEWESSLPIEIELIVATETAKPASGVAEAVEYLTPPGMTASPVYCRVARVNVPQRIYVSGLFGNNPAPNSSAEVREMFAILQRALADGGSDLRHLAKATYYVSDQKVSQLLNELRPQFYDPQRPPAASKAQVVGTGKPPRTITLD